MDPDELRRQALGILEESGADAVDAVDCRSLTLGEIPEWLVGVPTLLSVNDMQVFKAGMLYHIQDIENTETSTLQKMYEAKNRLRFSNASNARTAPAIKHATDDMLSNDGRSFIEPIQEKKEDTQDHAKGN